SRLRVVGGAPLPAGSSAGTASRARADEHLPAREGRLSRREIEPGLDDEIVARAGPAAGESRAPESAAFYSQRWEALPRRWRPDGVRAWHASCSGGLHDPRRDERKAARGFQDPGHSSPRPGSTGPRPAPIAATDARGAR